jgi:predicted TIM-barrel fold metal-dependent hydrolase
MDARIFDEAKIDCHLHVYDPARFPYRPDTHYAPAGQEIGTPAELEALMDAYGVRHVLLVQPNSGYDLDNACMLDTMARGGDRFKGVAVVKNDVSLAELARLRDLGIVGVAWNVFHYGVRYYDDAAPLLAKLADLDLFLDLGADPGHVVALMPLLASARTRILIDHCGRPDVAAGTDDAGFRALLALGATGRAWVKLSGFAKVSRQSAPYADASPFVSALLDAFTADRCLWASDWPYLRAPEHVDYGVLLKVAARQLPDPSVRRKVMWDNPRRLFGFGR